MGYNWATKQMKKSLSITFLAIVIMSMMTSCKKESILNPIKYISIPYAEYQVQQSNNIAIKVRYYIENKSSSTLCYLKFSAEHPCGTTDIREIGSKTDTSEWTLAPGESTYTPYYNCNIPYQDGLISGDIIDYMFY